MSWSKVLFLLLLGVVLVSARGYGPNDHLDVKRQDEPTDGTEATEAPATEPPPTEAPATEPPPTEAPTTEPPPTEAPVTQASEIAEEGLLVHFGGLCVYPNATLRRCDMNNPNLVMQLTTEGQLKHKASDQCLHVSRIDDSVLLHFGACGPLDFWSHNQHMRNLRNNKNSRDYCIHPERGATCPTVGTNLVLFNTCTDNRLKFRFVELGRPERGGCSFGKQRRKFKGW